MSLVQALFYIMSFVALGSALVVAMSSNLVRSIFMFFVTLFALAGLYVLALADFIAVTQVVIYVGGVLVLILFAFMLSGKETLAAATRQQNRLFRPGNLPALILAALFFVVIINLIFKADIAKLQWIRTAVANSNVIPANESGINNIGVNLMTRYLLPFEAISVLLMIALVGSAHLSRKEDKG